MIKRQYRLPLSVFAAIAVVADLAWAVGFQLGETKEQLKLKMRRLGDRPRYRTCRCRADNR